MHLALFIFCIVAAFSSGFARNGAPKPCCNKTTLKAVNVTTIVSYWKQKGHPCPVEAVVFTIKSGKTLCSDPNNTWTKWAMQTVDEKIKRKKESALATPMSPLASRWPQVPTSEAELVREGRASSPKPRRRRIKTIKRKRKGRKRKRTIPKQPVIDHAPSFITSSYN